MKLRSNVKLKKFPWTIIPLLSSYTAHAIYPNVYLPKQIYEDLLSDDPNPKNVSVLIHEQTHIKRQKEMGWFLWGLKYCLFGKFRFHEELAAIKESMKYYKQKGITWNTKRSANFLCSYLYLWCISYEEAKSQLDEIWKEA